MGFSDRELKSIVAGSLDWKAGQPPPPSFKCPQCGFVSYNENDIREGYCGRCHIWIRP